MPPAAGQPRAAAGEQHQRGQMDQSEEPTFATPERQMPVVTFA
jgi:hypothetical protein